MNLKISFTDWLAMIDRIIEAELGLAADDLADAPFVDWYDDDLPAPRAARRLIRWAGGAM